MSEGAGIIMPAVVVTVATIAGLSIGLAVEGWGRRNGRPTAGKTLLKIGHYTVSGLALGGLVADTIAKLQREQT